MKEFRPYDVSGLGVFSYSCKDEKGMDRNRITFVSSYFNSGGTSRGNHLALRVARKNTLLKC